ncbi:hypothetical protein KAJ87_02485 [Candidatus Pacearchaeota archaeon]|nr:hypothetical protein [Candidatus Pacearchaeota archaeon]
MEFIHLLIFTSFLLSFLLFVIDVGKVGKKFSRRKLFSIISLAFLPVLWLCVYFILDVSCKALFNPLIFLVFPIFLGVIIWSFIYSIKYKIFLGKIIPAFNVLIFIITFFLRKSVMCLD